MILIRQPALNRTPHNRLPTLYSGSLLLSDAFSGQGIGCSSAGYSALITLVVQYKLDAGSRNPKRRPLPSNSRRLCTSYRPVIPWSSNKFAAFRMHSTIRGLFQGNQEYMAKMSKEHPGLLLTLAKDGQRTSLCQNTQFGANTIPSSFQGPHLCS